MVGLTNAAQARAFVLMATAGAGFSSEYEGADRIGGNASLAFSGSSSIAQDRSRSLEQRLAATEGKRWQFGPSFNVIGAREADSISDRRAKNLPEVDLALELGGYVGLGATLRELGISDPASVNIQLAARHDILDGHSGFVVEPLLTTVRPFSDSVWGRLSVGGSWASEAYMDSYYSLSASEAAGLGLASNSFDASARIKDLRVENEMRVEFGERWSVGVENQYKYLLGDAADSPVTADFGSRHQWSTGVKVYFKVWDFSGLLSR